MLLFVTKMTQLGQEEVVERSGIKTQSLTLMIHLQMTVAALRWAKNSSPLFQVEHQVQDLAPKLLNNPEILS
jgi:hypothetical protein